MNKVNQRNAVAKGDIVGRDKITGHNNPPYPADRTVNEHVMTIRTVITAVVLANIIVIPCVLLLTHIFS